MRNNPVRIWMLEATNDDLCQHSWSPPWAVYPPGLSNGCSSRSSASRNGIYAPGIRREEIEELVPYLSAIYGSLLGAGAKLPADALELQVEWLCRTTTLALAAVQRIAESRAAHLDAIISSIAATISPTTRGIPNEPRCLSGAACTGGANPLFEDCNDVGELISEVYAELNDIAIDLMGTWFRTAQRFL
jgi:hypothetical protein